MASKTQKIAVVGNRDAILPFQMIGFQTFPVAEAQETINTLRHLSQEDFGIPDTIAHYDRQVTPAVILIPTHKGSTGLGRQRIRDNVEKAVGQDIL